MRSTHVNLRGLEDLEIEFDYSYDSSTNAVDFEWRFSARTTKEHPGLLVMEFTDEEEDMIYKQCESIAQEPEEPFIDGAW